MLAYHVNTNAILVKPFQSRKDRHHIAAYDCIMARLKNGGHTIDLQILDNESSQAYKLAIENNWTSKFHIFPPNVHCRNAAERAIRTFKAHFLTILVGISDSFSNFL